MGIKIGALLFLVAVGVWRAPAYGQARCDCDVVVDQCRAEISEIPTQAVGSRFLIRANTQQCAIVEWTIDGTRGQTTVWDDGEEIDKVGERTGAIEVRSCRVCQDRLRGGSATAQPTAASLQNDSRCSRALEDRGRAFFCVGVPLSRTIICKADGRTSSFTMPDPRSSQYDNGGFSQDLNRVTAAIDSAIRSCP